MQVVGRDRGRKEKKMHLPNVDESSSSLSADPAQIPQSDNGTTATSTGIRIRTDITPANAAATGSALCSITSRDPARENCTSISSKDLNLSLFSPSSKSIAANNADFLKGKDFQAGLLKEEGLKGGEGSNIYGGASGGGISFIGSWALRNCSNVAGRPGMSSKPSHPIPGNEEPGRVEEGAASSSANLMGSGGMRDSNEAAGPYPWRFEAGTSFEIRLSHLLKMFCVWVLAMGLAALLFHTRIRSLEDQRNELKSEVSSLSMKINMLSERMDMVIDLLPPKSSNDRDLESLAEEVDWDEEADELTQEVTPKGRSLVKRSASAHAGPTRNTKNLQYSRESMNALNNGTTPFDPVMDSWTTRKTTPTNDKSKGTRAAYLQIDGYSVHIKKHRQVIGPWYLSDTGKDIGFGSLWYDNLALDSNGTSVVFQEDGLFLIYAQVFYQLQQTHNVKPNPMGYRIHLKKNGGTSRKPLTIAECVPSFPTTVYQTCFTQVAWSVQAQDEIPR